MNPSAGTFSSHDMLLCLEQIWTLFARRPLTKSHMVCLIELCKFTCPCDADERGAEFAIQTLSDGTHLKLVFAPQGQTLATSQDELDFNQGTVASLFIVESEAPAKKRRRISGVKGGGREEDRRRRSEG
eukprot:7204443-Pyramimonas_sp.AAC.2